MKTFTDGIHPKSRSRSSLLACAAVTSVAFAGAWMPANTSSSSFAVPRWRRIAADYTYTYTSSPDSPSPDVQVRGLSLSFPSSTQVQASGDVLPLGLSPIYTFDAAELALPNADESVVLEPVTWLSLPPFVGEPQVGDVLVRASTVPPDDSHLVLRGTSTFTVTAVSTTEIEYTGVDTAELLATSKLREYAEFLSPDPGQVDATISDLQSAFEDVPLAEYHVVFDRNLGRISSIDAVWQMIPDGQVHSLPELRALPSRVELSIVRD
jgi:hypothetical protein